MDRIEYIVSDVCSDRYSQELALREMVLRKPLGMKLALDRAAEERSIHLLALVRERVVGVALLVPAGTGVVRLRQVAVAPALQGRGIGSALVLHAEIQARKLGVRRIELHARLGAAGFYVKLGYLFCGAEFVEIGLPHRRMYKVLGKNQARRDKTAEP